MAPQLDISIKTSFSSSPSSFMFLSSVLLFPCDPFKKHKDHARLQKVNNYSISSKVSMLIIHLATASKLHKVYISH
jgi:hypothetical protein